jgi:hypothetical protein
MVRGATQAHPIPLALHRQAPAVMSAAPQRALTEAHADDRELRARTPAGAWGDLRKLIGPPLLVVSRAAAGGNDQIVCVDDGVRAKV